METKLDNISRASEIQSFLCTLNDTPYRLEVKLGRRVFTSFVISNKGLTVTLGEFSPYYANSLVKRYKRAIITIRQLEGFEEVTRSFTAKFLEETQENNLLGYAYKITSTIKGRKSLYDISPRRRDNVFVIFNLGRDHFELPVRKMNKNEVFLFGNFDEYSDLFNTNIEKVSLGIPSRAVDRSSALVFAGRFIHIYGRSYALEGICEGEYNENLLLEYTRKNFRDHYEIDKYRTEGEAGLDLEKEDRAHRVLVFSDIQITVQKIVRSFRITTDVKIFSEEKLEDMKASLEKIQPDIILLDLDTQSIAPDKNITEIRKTGFQGPVFVLSFSNRTEKFVQAIRFGADAYFIKPIEPHYLIRRIKALIAPPPDPPVLKAIKPRAVFYSDDVSSLTNLITVIKAKMGDLSEDPQGIYVVDSYQKMLDAIRQYGADYIIICLRKQKGYSTEILEKIRKSRLIEHIKIILIAADDTDKHLLSWYYDDKLLILDNTDPEYVLEQIEAHHEDPEEEFMPPKPINRFNKEV